jgi:TonB family protein
MFLLSSEEDIAARIKVEALANYTKAIAEALDKFFSQGDQHVSRKLTVHLALDKNSHDVRAVAVPQLSNDAAEALRRLLVSVPAPGSGGPVALDYVVTLWADKDVGWKAQGCNAVAPGARQGAAQPEPAPRSDNAQQRPLIDDSVGEGCLLKKVDPVYPTLARQARVQGTVKFNVLINTAGEIEQLEVVSGHPMLINSAMDAVKQWRYKPYYVDGIAVEVRTTIKVNFTLSSEP